MAHEMTYKLTKELKLSAEEEERKTRKTEDNPPEGGTHEPSLE